MVETTLGTGAVAKMLNVSRDTIWRWTTTGVLPATVHPTSGRKLIRIEDVEQLKRRLAAVKS